MLGLCESFIEVVKTICRIHYIAISTRKRPGTYPLRQSACMDTQEEGEECPKTPRKEGNPRMNPSQDTSITEKNRDAKLPPERGRQGQHIHSDSPLPTGSTFRLLLSFQPLPPGLDIVLPVLDRCRGKVDDETDLFLAPFVCGRTEQKTRVNG